MKQHKWAKEIKAWADGAEIEYFDEVANRWLGVLDMPRWNSISEFRIKPQKGNCPCCNGEIELEQQEPKEPQYLYVYKMMTNAGLQIQLWDSKTYNNESYIGKIKLEDAE